MPNIFKNIIKSFTEKGSATRPDKDQQKKVTPNTRTQARTVEKEKHKSYSMFGGYGETYKRKDDGGNKVKESYKTYKNPLNQEQVTVRKRKENGRTTKEVVRDRYEGMGPIQEPLKEAISRAAGESVGKATGKAAGEEVSKAAGEPSGKFIGGTPAAAPTPAPKVRYDETDEQKKNRLIENIKKSQAETEESLKKAEKYKNAMSSVSADEAEPQRRPSKNVLEEIQRRVQNRRR
jgi:hypothetical protein